MPELTWTLALAWFGVLTGAASVAGLIVAVVGNRTVKAMHVETQTTLTQMDAGLKQVLDRMDARAEARYRDLKDRLGGEAAESE
jgi:hypothetical protein